MNESMKKKLYALSQIALVGMLVCKTACVLAADEAPTTATPAATSTGSAASAVVMVSDMEKQRIAAQKAQEDAAAKRFEAALGKKADNWAPRKASEKKALEWKEVKSGIGLKPDMIAVGPRVLWCIERGRIYKQENDEWKPCGLGVFIAAASDGTVVSINDKNEVFTYRGGDTWVQMKDIELSEIAVQDSKNMVGFLENKDGSVAKVMECVNGEWQEALNILKNPAMGLADIGVNKLGFELGVTPNGTPVMLNHESRSFVESEEVVTHVTKRIEKHRQKHGHAGAGKKHGAAIKAVNGKARAGAHHRLGKGVGSKRKGNGERARFAKIKKRNAQLMHHAAAAAKPADEAGAEAPAQHDAAAADNEK